uniref:Uncharacterized protein n=1 Tax=Chromera velia CCMP2878 TaxID=1169474 RepID=A0A0G4I1V7_9ALVE|eukprot:Cvel_10242.t1-p1 / transcript=Cvel_10242.t1 / gene=Cvel_10242 / organism=Chromera_velia_CCMP2878 / gene_product=Myosin-14, putative / transcript_product=Myosin-14, putative / location=Cvel_scaffold613:61860-69183(+) / protein_length=756 / sequence_SO=supercontig / SO=protein_coding / is_pseudo=false
MKGSDEGLDAVPRDGVASGGGLSFLPREAHGEGGLHQSAALSQLLSGPAGASVPLSFQHQMPVQAQVQAEAKMAGAQAEREAQAAFVRRVEKEAEAASRSIADFFSERLREQQQEWARRHEAALRGLAVEALQGSASASAAAGALPSRGGPQQNSSAAAAGVLPSPFSRDTALAADLERTLQTYVQKVSDLLGQHHRQQLRLWEGEQRALLLRAQSLDERAIAVEEQVRGEYHARLEAALESHRREKAALVDSVQTQIAQQEQALEAEALRVHMERATFEEGLREKYEGLISRLREQREEDATKRLDKTLEGLADHARVERAKAEAALQAERGAEAKANERYNAALREAAAEWTLQSQRAVNAVDVQIRGEQAEAFEALRAQLDRAMESVAAAGSSWRAELREAQQAGVTEVEEAERRERRKCEAQMADMQRRHDEQVAALEAEMRRQADSWETERSLLEGKARAMKIALAKWQIDYRRHAEEQFEEEVSGLESAFISEIGRVAREVARNREASARVSRNARLLSAAEKANSASLGLVSPGAPPVAPALTAPPSSAQQGGRGGKDTTTTLRTFGAGSPFSVPLAPGLLGGRQELQGGGQFDGVQSKGGGELEGEGEGEAVGRLRVLTAALQRLWEAADVGDEEMDLFMQKVERAVTPVEQGGAAKGAGGAEGIVEAQAVLEVYEREVRALEARVPLETALGRREALLKDRDREQQHERMPMAAERERERERELAEVESQIPGLRAAFLAREGRTFE